MLCKFEPCFTTWIFLTVKLLICFGRVKEWNWHRLNWNRTCTFYKYEFFIIIKINCYTRLKSSWAAFYSEIQIDYEISNIDTIFNEFDMKMLKNANLIITSNDMYFSARFLIIIRHIQIKIKSFFFNGLKNSLKHTTERV